MLTTAWHRHVMFKSTYLNYAQRLPKHCEGEDYGTFNCACLQATFSGPLDVIRKSIQAEGVLSVYKGVSANYARFGPYCVLVFLFLEQLRAAEIRLRKWRYAQIAQR
eukprot:707952-Pleurochrysis_carterae.AAC.1